MASHVNEVIKRLSIAFKRTFDDYKGLYLFGSFLDGKEHEDEDIEIVALFETEDKSKREQIWPIVGKIETALDVSIDLYPYTQEQFEKDEDIYKEVMEEGLFFNPLGIMEDK
ncbi:nucleotidyltransferase domain-containing protein [Spirochaetes bacterium]|uniref:Nucleotidyltransferase domain-containing protein n=1 Tax=Candidatus Scatousia excrementipullorum TaxID=2840936 RepID=A0A9D9DTC3_9BACT|nr:nucleotidyltransferase domain-containing protein [Candidatus Scatousia excrementipullorum]